MQLAFSVLMSVYAKDRPAWVRQALDSVLTNTVKPTEVVIMVDGPVGTDLQAVLDESAKNPLVRVISHPVNIGRGAALAIAVPQCKHELIALMDADDVSRKDRFEKQLAAFAVNPGLAVCGGQIEEVDAESFASLSKRTVPLTHADIKQYLKTRMPFNNQTIMFKKAAVLDSGNFRAFGLLEDYYMWVRVAAKGYQMTNLPDILVDMRVNSAMYSRRGGYNYFHMNKLLFDEMRQLNLLSTWEYYYTLSVRFVVQVLMPNCLRSMFYKRALR
jgi:glycosyltransferase involved in cell wall biosynthesis